jgi:chromosome segregation ATPase
MPADHQRLADHARQRHHDTLHRAERTLAELADAGQPVTVALLADRAGVSRSWIYTQPELHNRIKQLQQHLASADLAHHAVTRASDDSLRQRLAMAHERINQLRTENQQLRAALAHVHGQLREARLGSTGQ